MARVSRLAEERSPAAIASPAPMESARGQRAEVVRDWSDVPSWVAATAGLAIVFVSWVGGRLQPGSALDLASTQLGATDILKMAPNGSAALGLAMGLLLYLTGLFAPLRHRQ